MDRRGLLRFMGVSAASAIVAPKLLLPAVRQIAVQDPQRRFSLPPATVDFPDRAAPVWGENESALGYIENIEKWSATAMYMVQPGATYGWPQGDEEVHGPGYQGYLISRDCDYRNNRAPTVTDRWEGRGPIPDALLQSRRVGGSAPIKVSMTRRLPARFITLSYYD